jgi:hypothetical protein
MQLPSWVPLWGMALIVMFGATAGASVQGFNTVEAVAFGLVCGPGWAACSSILKLFDKD